MPTDILDLERKIAELTRELNAAKEREKGLVVVKFSGFRIVNEKLKFGFNPRRPDILECLNAHGIRPDAYADASIDPRKWDDLETSLIHLANVDLKEIDNTKRAEWRSYTPPHHLIIKLDANDNWIVFDNAPNYSMSAVDGDVHWGKSWNKYVIPVSSIHKLSPIIAKLYARRPDSRIFVTPEVQALLDSDENRRQKYADLTSLDYTAPERIQNGTTLRNYQSQTVDLLNETDGNMIVALDMGLGKSLCALTFMSECLTKNPKTKFLIIGPAFLRANWAKEIRKYLPEAKVIHLYGSAPTSWMMKELIGGDSNVYFISYETLRASVASEDVDKIYPWSMIFSNVADLRLVVDEAHYFKNPSTANAQSINAIQNALSITPMTGTPMKNGPKELYTLIRAIAPDIAGSYDGWNKVHTINNGKNARNPLELNELLKPLMFRRLIRDVIPDLPPVNRITIECELSSKARTIYDNILLGFYSTLDAWTGDPSDAQTVNGLLAQMIRMKQVCSEDKIPFIADRAIETYESDESDHPKVIIFSQFVNSPPTIPKIRQLLGHEAISITGSDDDKMALAERFQDDDSIHYLLTSLKEGLTLTSGGHVIHADLLWVPDDHKQIEGRAYGRANDPHSITSTYIVCENTIEEDIVDILTSKIAEQAAVLDGKIIGNGGASIAMDVLATLKNRRG